jgi:hypothetical protein
MHLLASTVSSGRMTVHYELEVCGKEAIVYCYKAVFWHFTAISEESHTTQLLETELSRMGS